MAKLYDKAFLVDKILPLSEANLSIASSAVLYGMSVYTVFPVLVTAKGVCAFRLEDHYKRIKNSARIIGMDSFDESWSFEKFKNTVSELVHALNPKENIFIRATWHAGALLPGTRTKNVNPVFSMFAYSGKPALPESGTRLKTSAWRRVPDYSIPARAKVNGAYVNSALSKQEALDTGYDDAVILDKNGHVCELTTANIFIIKDGILITPGSYSDILEGISRKTIIEIAKEMGIPTLERPVDLTELYTAEEAFACGTSAYIAPVIEIDTRKISQGIGPISRKLKERYENIFKGIDPLSEKHLTLLS